MQEKIKNYIDQPNGDLGFATETDKPNLELLKLYEDSFNSLRFKVDIGDDVTGKIVKIEKETALVDFKYRQMGLVNVTKEKANLEEGCEYNFTVKDIIGEEIHLSSDEYVRTQLHSELIKNIEFNSKLGRDIRLSDAEKVTFYDAKVKSIWNKAGFVVEINGIDCFMPGSLADINKMFNFDKLLNKTIKVAPVNFDKDNIVVSRKLYLQTLVPLEIKKLEIGTKWYEGLVTGSNSYGVFVKFNDLLTGMIYYSELEGQDEIDFANGNIKDGSKIKFKVKSIQKETKIVLTQKKEDTWLTSIKEHKVGSNVEVTVLKFINKGYLVSINSVLRGLMRSENKYNVNDKVVCKILSIDKTTKKIYLEN